MYPPDIRLADIFGGFPPNPLLFTKQRTDAKEEREADMQNLQIKRGDIYYIAPTNLAAGSEQDGYRPAIVVSNNANNQNSSVIEVVYTTMKRKKVHLPTHVEITSCPQPSIALAEQITPVDISRFRTYLGHITAKEESRLNEALAISLNLFDMTDIIRRYQLEILELKRQINTRKEQRTKALLSGVSLDVAKRQVRVAYQIKGEKNLLEYAVPVKEVECFIKVIGDELQLYRSMINHIVLTYGKAKKAKADRLVSVFEDLKQAWRREKKYWTPKREKELLDQILKKYQY